MTDIKKKQTGKGGAKGKKLQLNKETLEDLNAKKEASPKGGADRRGDHCCSWEFSGCW